MFRRMGFIAATTLVLASVPSAAFAILTTVFSETFDSDTANAEATYPAFTHVRTPAANGTATAAGGQLILSQQTSGVDGGFITDATYTGMLEAHLDVGRTAGNSGNATVGVAIGNRVFHFFPGFPDGAFRVGEFNPATGVFGAILVSNTDMGFTPAPGSLHHMEVISDGLGEFDILIEDANSASVFNFNYSDGTFVAGPVGPAYKDFNSGSGLVGAYDNFAILQDVPAPPLIPEPATWLLLAPGSLALALRRHRRQAVG